MAGPSVQIIGRYALFDEIASGGMATVHIGRLAGEVGFSRTVAIKRLHPQLAKVPEFVSMLVDEARLAARIRHPNVVPTLDVVKTGDELFLVMEYVHGESLQHLLKHCRRTGMVLPARYVVPIIAGVLHGLHAAHEAKGEGGQPLEIVHRDVSPQNILVGTDGVARVFDFGIAKACGRLQVTRTGELKGKLPYMAPEQLSGGVVGRRADVYATAVVLWEALTGRRLFRAEFEGELFAQVLGGAREPPSAIAPDVPKELDELVMRGLAMSPANRFASAREMAYALERTVPGASPAEIGEWVEREAGEVLALRAARIDEIESRPSMVTKEPDKPQRTLGPYELVAELHKSYLGPCWAARPPSAAEAPSEIVLIRRIYVQPDRARAGAEPAALQQLAAAARATMGWRHERLVPVVDTIQTDDEIAVVSQYVEGETLRSLTWMAGIRRAAIPPAVALRIAMELLEGLDFLHAQRLADPTASSFVGLTADDVLVATDGHARLLEPGVAGVAATLEPWSRHPKRACYDAPEQLRDGALVDLRADLFTVGVLLWEMIQNRPLFTGSSLSEVYEGIVSGVIEQVQTSPVVHARGTADALAHVVARALERDEMARYQSASEMLTALAKAGQPVASPAQVAELLERLAGSSLTAQRQRIDADPATASTGRSSKGRAAAAETPVGAPWASSHGSSTVSAASAGLLPPLPFATPQGGATRPSFSRSSHGGLQVARASGLAAPPPGGAPGVHVHGLAGNAAPQLSEPPEPLPTTVFDPEEGPTISGGSNTGIRRVMPLAISDPIPGSLADLSFPQQASRKRLVLMVVVASTVLGAVVAGVMHMLTPGGGGVDAASAPTAVGLAEPARATEDETSAAAAPTADVESSASAPGSAASAPPRSDKEHAHPGDAKGRASGTSPSAGPPASAKPPPQDQRYVPTHI